MANLTAAERAKRYRQRKAGKRVAAPPRLERRSDIQNLWLANCMTGDKCSLRTFYRRRAMSLRFVQHAPDERLRTVVPEVVSYVRKHLLAAEWRTFLARLELLGIPVEDKSHRHDAQ